MKSSKRDDKNISSGSDSSSNKRTKRGKAIAFYMAIFSFLFSIVFCSFDARFSPHILYSCSCYSFLFSSDNNFPLFLFYFFDLLNGFYPFVFRAFVLHFFIHFSNSIHCGMYGVTSGVFCVQYVRW